MSRLEVDREASAAGSGSRRANGYGYGKGKGKKRVSDEGLGLSEEEQGLLSRVSGRDEDEPALQGISSVSSAYRA